VARQAVQEAGAADATVTSLNEAASRIGDVVRLIGDIAGQTNLLALDATIEGDRAGPCPAGGVAGAAAGAAVGLRRARSLCVRSPGRSTRPAS
jgi:hypothetical protein